MSNEQNNPFESLDYPNSEIIRIFLMLYILICLSTYTTYELTEDNPAHESSPSLVEPLMHNKSEKDLEIDLERLANATEAFIENFRNEDSVTFGPPISSITPTNMEPIYSNSFPEDIYPFSLLEHEGNIVCSIVGLPTGYSLNEEELQTIINIIQEAGLIDQLVIINFANDPLRNPYPNAFSYDIISKAFTDTEFTKEVVIVNISVNQDLEQ